MMRALGLWLLPLTLLVAACQRAPDLPPPSPALFEVISPEGNTGWVFGTVHSLPDGMDWRTPVFEETLEKAGWLVVEVAALTDQKTMESTFLEMSTTPGQEPLLQKVAPEDRAALTALLDSAGADPADFEMTETWAVATMLAQYNRVGNPKNGVDRSLLIHNEDLVVVELEGLEEQLATFDELAEEDQRDFLTAVVRESGSSEKGERMLMAWRQGDTEAMATETERGMMEDPELREALLVGRNREWLERIEVIMREDRKPFIAVGAGHVVGPYGLPAMLKESGFEVRRIQ